jgi:hypothetical protein
MHPNYQYGTSQGLQGQYMVGTQGQIGYQGYGQDQWNVQEQYSYGHVGDGIEGMDSFFHKIGDHSWTGTKEKPAAKPSPSADGRGGAGAGGVRSSAAGGRAWRSGGHGGGLSSSDYYEESEESRYHETRRGGNEQDQYSGGAGQTRPQQPQQPRRRRSKDHRGVSADEMRKMFEVLVRIDFKLNFVPQIIP